MENVARLFDLHHESLFRYLVRFCGDADAAADAVQETFVRLIEQRAPRGAERAWLFTVASNLVMEAGRTRARRTRLLDESPERAPMGDAPRDPHELLEAADKRSAVARALSMLSVKERTALLMREEGFTHREIADVLGTTTGSMGTLIARALDRLAQQLPPHSEAL
ncbi:MAG: RNA polymerase sigma factor [Gemmatimonadaceae bacterium]